MSNCPFCQKTYKEYYIESENFAAIYNISPILPGHSLVIPKVHKESLFELSEKELSEFMSLGRKTAQFLSKVFKTDAFDWSIQEKEEAGQSVKHLHMHVIARRAGDLPDPGDWYQLLEKVQPKNIDTYEKFKLTKEQLNVITSKLKCEAEKLSFN